MTRKALLILFGLSVTLTLPAAAFAQLVRQDIGTKLLVPSSARTGAFTSLLVVLNMDTQPNTVEIRARRPDGSSLGNSLTVGLAVGGSFRSTDILGELGAPVDGGSFGPITVESLNNRLLSAVSEVYSAQGTAGFFPGVNVDSAWTLGFIPEIAETGDRGVPGTHRTNLGLNTVSGSSASVQVTFFNNAGQPVGVVNRTVPGNGLDQINIRDSFGLSGPRTGYLRISSDRPLLAWASKIENFLNDPSFEIGVASAGAAMSQIEPTAVVIQNQWMAAGLALLAAFVVVLWPSRPVRSGPSLRPEPQLDPA
ncbi:MAG: hypothetical protein AB1898_26775 [Acidobacteriota bacterium]